MKNSWEIYKFGTITNLQRGYNPPKKEFISSPKEGYVRFYQIRDGWSDKYVVYVPDTPKLHKVSPDDILMVAYRHIGRAFRRADGAFNVALCKISNKRRDILDDEFLYHLTQTNFVKGELLKRSERSLIPSMSVEHLRNLEVALPLLPKQKHIVKILDKAFAAIDKAKANAKKNLQNSQELFDSYLNNVFANPGEDWKEKMIRELGVVQTGTTPKTSQRENFGSYIPFVKPADFNSDGSICYNTEGLSEIGLKNSRHIAENSTLMVCIGATIGKTGFAEKAISCNQQINSLTTNAEYYPKFFYYAMLTKSFQTEVIKSSGQATLPIINKTKWSNLTIHFPKEKEHQKQLSDKFDKLITERKKLETNYQQKLTDLEELKKSILQKAFNGELTTKPVPHLI